MTRFKFANLLSFWCQSVSVQLVTTVRLPGMEAHFKNDLSELVQLVLEIFVENDSFGMLSPGTYFVTLDARTKSGDIEWCNQIPFLVAFHHQG